MPTADGTVVAAVADGLGDPAARFSAVGARIASVLSCRLVGVRLEGGQPIDPHAVSAQLATEMMPHARRFLSGDYDETSLATTLITAWVAPGGTYGGFMIGDGGVLVLAADQVSAAACPRATSFSHTDALPGAYTHVQEFSGRLEGGSALLLATDGLADPMLSPDVAAVLAHAWERPPAILDFLYEMSFERRGEADDRTGVGIWFDPGHTR